MSISTPFIQRPVATSLLLVAMTLAGGIAYTLLPVSALPEVDFPTITVSAGLPGASPEVMAASVATPLEKQFTRIAGVSEMTSQLGGSAQITLQFDLSRDINAAGRKCRRRSPPPDRSRPICRRCRNPEVNPADQPIPLMTLGRRGAEAAA
jgi:multidrug efflux pump